MKHNTKICIAFLGNAYHDSRISNLKNSLENDNCKVKVISFDWITDNFENISGEISVFKLKKRKWSLFFYLKFFIRLNIELFKSKADIYFAEDIYTLPSVILFGKLFSGKVYYNSRELYAFIGGLRNKKKIQFIWQKIERFFIKKADLVMTTGEMDSQFIEEFYGINNTVVIRNLPLLKTADYVVDLRKELNIIKENLMLLYQGVLINGRGLDLIIRLMKNIPAVEFVIIGDGELRNKLKSLAVECNVQDRVHFLGMKTQDELINYTAAADVGMIVIENISKSYYYALPNKLFECIMAGVPVVCSNLPQMEKIVHEYQVGETINPNNPESLIQLLNDWKENSDKIIQYRSNCKKACLELNWQKEYEKVKFQLLPHLYNV
jgi:glycosyltransferase involved in cell wall biosynthesis